MYGMTGARVSSPRRLRESPALKNIAPAPSEDAPEAAAIPGAFPMPLAGALLMLPGPLVRSLRRRRHEKGALQDVLHRGAPPAGEDVGDVAVPRHLLSDLPCEVVLEQALARGAHYHQVVMLGMAEDGLCHVRREDEDAPCRHPEACDSAVDDELAALARRGSGDVEQINLDAVAAPLRDGSRYLGSEPAVLAPCRRHEDLADGLAYLREIGERQVARRVVEQGVEVLAVEPGHGVRMPGRPEEEEVGVELQAHRVHGGAEGGAEPDGGEERHSLPAEAGPRAVEEGLAALDALHEGGNPGIEIDLYDMG